MSARLGFRLAAVAFAALVILIAIVQARRPALGPPAAAAVSPVKPRSADARLARCQALGAAGAQDADCLKAWADARARFLGASAKTER